MIFSPGRWAVQAALAAMLPICVLATACEKNNDVVVREQAQEASNVCAKGCEVPPRGCTIKGNVSNLGNKYYHTKDQPSWVGIKIQVDRGERWFCNEAEAIANGFRKSIN